MENTAQLVDKLTVSIEIPSWITPTKEEAKLIGKYSFEVDSNLDNAGRLELLTNLILPKTEGFNKSLFFFGVYDDKGIYQFSLFNESTNQ